MTWWRRLVARETLDRQLDREVADHIARQTHDFMRAGMSESEARRRATLIFGAPEAVKEECRDVRGTGWVFDAGRDARHAVRQLRKHPASALAAALSLGLAIGAVAAIYSLVDAVLLRPLPVEAPDRLVLLGEQAGDHEILSWSLTQFRSFAESPSFAGLCAFRPRADVSVIRDGHAEVAPSQLLSGNCYEVLGIRAELGRLFTEADERDGDAHPVAVISDGFWRRQFAADRTVVGRTLELKGHSVTIVGVTPPEFFGLEAGRAIDISVPLTLQSWLIPGPLMSSPTVRWLRLIGRLAPDTSLDRAQSELAARWAPIVPPPANAGAILNRFELLDGAQGLSELHKQFSGPLRLLFGGVLVLLFLACANLATLTLARNHARAGEVSLRLALGARRSRVVRQLFTESLVLSIVAGVAALGIAYWASQTIVALLSRGRSPIVLSIGLDARVLLVTLLISVVAGVIFGLWPAVEASRANLQPGLQTDARTTTGRRGRRWHVLIAAQTALSVVLVIAAALFSRSLAKLYAADVGVDTRQVMLVAIGPGMAGARMVPAVIDDFYARLSAAPGVQAVSTAMDMPFGGSSYRAPITVAGQATDENENVSHNFVGPRFFETLGIPLIVGRDFVATDDASHQPVGVISRSLALRYFNGTNPIGKTVRANATDIEVVGVAKDVPYEGIRAERELMLYRPVRQAGQRGNTFAIRSTLPAAAVATLIRQTLHDVAPEVPVASMTTLADQLDGNIAAERLLADIAAFFGVMSLLLVAIGMYGTLANSLAQRGREFGVRRALGASGGALARMILLRALAPVLTGLAAGIPLALVTTRLGETMLFGVTPRDPSTYLGSAAVIVLVVVIAAAVPARSAVRASVVSALRQS